MRTGSSAPRCPTLPQSANPTTEGSWTGAISAWGVALQRTGQYGLSTLRPGSAITFGGTGAQDLANFDVFVMPEPNSPLTAAEKTAIMRFIQSGGGFFLIVDHTGSDRNVTGLVWRSTASQSGSTGAFFTTSTFGTGRVAVWGDSSAIDDGTGQSGNTLFNGWNDPTGTDAALALNATAWLAG